MALLVFSPTIEGFEGHTLHRWWEELYDLDCSSFQLLTQTQDVMMHGRFAGAVVPTSCDWD